MMDIRLQNYTNMAVDEHGIQMFELGTVVVLGAFVVVV
jgi:hypothetical protein